MKTSRNPLLIAFAVIGICAILYGAWHMYQQHTADSDARVHSLRRSLPVFQTFCTPRRQRHRCRRDSTQLRIKAREETTK